MHSMDSNDTLDRWLQTVSDEEAIRALTHALAVVKVRAELRQQQHVSTPSPVPAAPPPATIESPVDAASMRKPSLEQALSVQLQPEPAADQSRIAVPVAEAAVEVVTAQVPVPTVVVDDLQNTKTLVSALTEATQPPVVAVETDSSVASTFNRATAKTLVFDRSTMSSDEIKPEAAAQPEASEPVAIDQASMGKTMQFGVITPVPAAVETSASVAKTLLFTAPAAQTTAMMPRRDSIEESLLVPQRNKLAVIAMLAAGALLLVGLGALVAAVLSPSEPVVVVAPKEDEPVKAAAAEGVTPVPVAAQMTAQQSQEAVQRARAAAESAAEAKRVAAEEDAERMAAAKAPTLAPAPVVEAKKVARTVAEPISAEKPAMVAVSPKAVVPAPAPAPVVAPKSVAAPAPVMAASAKTVVAPAPMAPKHAAPAPVVAPAPRRGSQSADPLDSRR